MIGACQRRASACVKRAGHGLDNGSPSARIEKGVIVGNRVGKAPENLHGLVRRGASVENNPDHQKAGHAWQTLMADEMQRHAQTMFIHAVQTAGQQFAETDARVAAFGLDQGKTRTVILWPEIVVTPDS